MRAGRLATAALLATAFAVAGWTSPASAAGLPDFAVSAGGFTGAVPHGYSANVSLQVSNNSDVPEADGALTLTLPAGLSLAQEGLTQQGYAPPVCSTAGQTITCALHHMDTFDGQFLSVDVAAAAPLPIGSQVDITATFVPNGGDAAPADNTATIPVTIQGAAHLAYSLSIPTTRLTVGRPVTGTVTVTDVGPDAATDLVVNVGVLAQPKHFTVSVPGAQPFTNGAAIGALTLGTLPAGTSVTSKVVITGVVPGTGLFLANYGGADTVDPDPQCDSRACNAAVSVQLDVVAATIPSTPASTPTSSAASSAAPVVATEPSAVGPTLAATGRPVRGGLVLGFSLLAAGLCLTVGSRRRADRSH